MEFGDIRRVLSTAILRSLRGELEAAIGIGPAGFETVLRAWSAPNAATVVTLAERGDEAVASAM